jgi:hypothetical protein
VDEYGDLTAAPPPNPLAGPAPAGLIMDVVANAGAKGCTKFRFPIEQHMNEIYVHKIFGRGAGVNINLLKPCNVLPIPDDSTLSKVYLCNEPFSLAYCCSTLGPTKLPITL